MAYIVAPSTKIDPYRPYYRHVSARKSSPPSSPTPQNTLKKKPTLQTSTSSSSLSYSSPSVLRCCRRRRVFARKSTPPKKCNAENALKKKPRVKMSATSAVSISFSDDGRVDYDSDCESFGSSASVCSVKIDPYRPYYRLVSARKSSPPSNPTPQNTLKKKPPLQTTSSSSSSSTSTVSISFSDDGRVDYDSDCESCVSSFCRS